VPPESRLHPLTLDARWPFDVRRSPFYYGWTIWLLSTLGFLMSVPGQTLLLAFMIDSLGWRGALWVPAGVVIRQPDPQVSAGPGV